MSRDEEWYNLEDAFHQKDRKQFRKEKKLASQKDRSQYKKTDQDQILKNQVQIVPENAQLGRVIEVKPEGVVVAYEGSQILCPIRGFLKKQQQKTKNLVAVGDMVYFRNVSDGEGIIVDVAPRHSFLSRADNLSRNKEQLIAVNVDIVIITCSVMYPRLRPSLVDRYIIAAKKGNMTPVIVINKIDLLDDNELARKETFFDEEEALLEEFIGVYRDLGYVVIPTSVEKGIGVKELEEAIQGYTVVFSGQSGVGKSSLINKVTGADLRTREIVGKTNKGAHTTTTAKLIPLLNNGFCIDTPGIRSFGIWNITKEEVRSYFHEFEEHAAHCKYPDCTHINEPNCVVQSRLDEGAISYLRFASYLALMGEVEEEHRPR